jgi:oligosaccharide repeat unit polymerase
MTAKGIGLESDLSGNLLSIFESLRSYVAAPILACSILFNSLTSYDLGQNSFRTIIAILNAVGLDDLEPINLIRGYVAVPWPTNVYTVYEVYFKDFSMIGFYIPSLMLVIHFWLYKKAQTIGDKWLFIYAASVYPLVMQFFQDQYFSLLSMHVQIVFWCVLLFKSSKQIKIEND